MTTHSSQARRVTSLLRRAVAAPFHLLDKWVQRTVYALKLARAFGHDYRRYAAHGPKPYSVPRRDQLRAVVAMECHVLEKALSLKKTRPGYGQKVANRLLRDTEQFIRLFGDDWRMGVAADVLQAYCDFNRTCGLDYPDLVAGIARIRGQTAANAEVAPGGQRPVAKDDVLAHSQRDLSGFFGSRHSIRHFSPEEVDDGLIAQAVAMARKTPSVCNRQCWKAYVYSELEVKNRLLELQNGHRGFGEQISRLLVLTSDLQAFVSIDERNQAWIDGGMFAMSVVYALHSLGLGTCCLNLCHTPKVEKEIKAAGAIPDSEVLLMMVAVGHLPDSFCVAASPRKPMAEVLIRRP